MRIAGLCLFPYCWQMVGQTFLCETATPCQANSSFFQRIRSYLSLRPTLGEEGKRRGMGWVREGQGEPVGA